MPELSKVKDELAKLVKKYRAEPEKLGQNEARTRQYLIDPFWEALGWDMRNPDHVDVESNVQADQLDLSGEEPAGTKRADYTFLHSYNKTAFVVEAKKPKVSLRDEKVINQLKRYGFTLGIDIGILHDFEEFRAFDTAFPVTPRPEVNLIKEFDIGYEQYPDTADKLLETFGREAVLGGSIQKLVGRVRKGKSTIPVDRHFLDMLKDWRKDLAIGLAEQNPAYSIHDINEYVGRILNRIIFLRVVEERHALTGKPLEGAWNDYRRYADVGAKIKLYEQLKPFFLEMNEIFNGVLFKPTDWDDMKVPNPPVYDMLREIYNPLVPYDFGVIPVELLGTIYERFLGEVVVREDDEVKIEVKPEVRKAGGVYYTPKYIVDYIVEQTVGKLIEGKTPEQIRKIKILDPACGSGSFLIGAYERLMKYHLEWFKKHPKKIKAGIGRADAYVDGDNNWRLGFHVKQQILVNNIFGVDIDGRAVDVTMLSLYLKLMEDETYLTLEGMKYLPDLNDNIKCGNSLIGSDIMDMDILPTDPDERQAELERINPFDWEKAFPEIFAKGGFDAVIGNPPYITYALGRGRLKHEQAEIAYISEKFEKSSEYKINSFAVFYEKAIQLMRNGGLSSYIVPGTILINKYLSKIRNYILSECVLELVVSLKYKVFADAEMGDCSILVVRKKRFENYELKLIKHSSDDWKCDLTENVVTKDRILEIPQNKIFVEPNVYTFLELSNNPKLSPLGKICKLYNGIKSGDNKRFLSETSKSKEYLPVIRGRDFNRYKPIEPSIFIFFDPSLLWSNTNKNILGVKGKIIVRQTGDRLKASFEEQGIYCMDTVHMIYESDYNLKYILGLINSGVLNRFHNFLVPELGKTFAEVKIANLKQLPIRTIDFDNPEDVAKHDRMVSLVEDMLALNKRLQETESPSTRKSIEAQIAHTDRKINELVYDLYGLTDEEIAIVEDSAK